MSCGGWSLVTVITASSVRNQSVKASISVKLSKTLKDKLSTSGVASAVREYEDRFRKGKRSWAETKKNEYKEFGELYYDLVTDLYEYGWGRCFHFAPRVPGESFKASLVRHQRYLAQTLGPKPKMVVADLGCGVGRPLLEIARFSGAKIVGVNSSACQLQRARRFTEDAESTHLAEFLHCDLLDVDAPDDSFDAVYAIGATCYAPDKLSIYGKVLRLLKPCACFGAYDWCLTDHFAAQDPLHLKIKADIELGSGLLDIDDRKTIDNALRSVGFEVLEARELSVQTGPLIPWYQPLIGSRLSLAGLRSSMIGRWVTHNSLKALEALHIAPRGTVRVSETLNLCAAALTEAGRLGIFTPMYFIHARKPA